MFADQLGQQRLLHFGEILPPCGCHDNMWWQVHPMPANLFQAVCTVHIHHAIYWAICMYSCLVSPTPVSHTWVGCVKTKQAIVIECECSLIEWKTTLTLHSHSHLSPTWGSLTRVWVECECEWAFWIQALVCDITADPRLIWCWWYDVVLPAHTGQRERLDLLTCPLRQTRMTRRVTYDIIVQYAEVTTISNFRWTEELRPRQCV